MRKVHNKIARARKNYLHKLTTQLSKNHATIVLKDLRVANMSKSAKGTIIKPGRSVKAKSGLNDLFLIKDGMSLEDSLLINRLGLVEASLQYLLITRVNNAVNVSISHY